MNFHMIKRRGVLVEEMYLASLALRLAMGYGEYWGMFALESRDIIEVVDEEFG